MYLMHSGRILILNIISFGLSANGVYGDSKSYPDSTEDAKKNISGLSFLPGENNDNSTPILSSGFDDLPEKVVFCHMPTFYKEQSCGESANPIKSIKDLIMFDVAKLPPSFEEWIHIDVIPTKQAVSSGKSLKIKYAMIQISDSQNRIIGRIAEQVPCTSTGHPQYLRGYGRISELYNNPGIKNIDIYECRSKHLINKQSWPTVGVLSFLTLPTEAFYVNFKFIEGEINLLKTDKIFITTMLSDTSGKCYLHTVEYQKLKPHDGYYELSEPEVPVNCHLGGPAFKMNSQSGMVNKSVAHNKSIIKFEEQLDLKRSRGRIPNVDSVEWRYAIADYNMDVYGLDELGYTEAEIKEIKESEKRETALVVPDDHADDWDRWVNMERLNFDPDEQVCNDEIRIKKPEDMRNEIVKLYFECKYYRQCSGEPVGCLEDKSCNFVVSWRKDGDYVLFGVIADDVTYVAVGLSEDDKMGDDSVVECCREGDVVVGYTSWNFLTNEQLGNTRLKSCEPMQEFMGDVLNDRIFCSWKRPIVTKVKGHTFDLNKPYYVLTASGHVSFPGVFGNIEKHETRGLVLRSAVVLNKEFGKSKLQFWMTRAHGMVMIVTWMVMVPVATFVSRYLKGTFVTARILGYSVWYGLHFILMGLSIVFTMTTTILLFILNDYEKGKNEARYSLHSRVGVMMCVSLLIQFILAEFITDSSKWKEKWNLKFIHGVMGHGLEICGHVCILSSRNVKDGLPCNVVISYSVYLVICMIFHLIMSYQVCYSDFVRGRETSRIYKIFIIESDKEHDLPRKPRRRMTRKAEAYRRRHLTLDDIAESEIEEGAIIDPTVKQSVVDERKHSHADDNEDDEEPGTIMRRIILLQYIWIPGLFALYYVSLMCMPDRYLDCPTQEELIPNNDYLPGHVYF